MGPTAEPVGLQETAWLGLSAAGTGPRFTNTLPQPRVGISPNACGDQCTGFHCFSSALSEALFEILGYVFVLVKSLTFTDLTLSFI